MDLYGYISSSISYAYESVRRTIVQLLRIIILNDLVIPNIVLLAGRHLHFAVAPCPFRIVQESVSGARGLATL